MRSAALVSSVCRTPASGMSSGMEMSGCLGIGMVLSLQQRDTARFCTSSTPDANLERGLSTASPEEPKNVIADLQPFYAI
jgi:hypothetical protein